MKFAKSLLRNQVPEWSQSYIDYKGLKKLVKRAALATEYDLTENGTVLTLEDATTQFFYALDRNSELVDILYNTKYVEYSRRLGHIVDRFPVSKLAEQLDPEELTDLISVFLELRTKLRKLQWFAELNKRGFEKILKKFDKKVGTHSQSEYFSSKIAVLGFANVSNTIDLIATTNKYLNVLAPGVQAGTAGDNFEDHPHTLTLNSNSTSTSLNLSEEVSLYGKAVDSNDLPTLESVYSKHTFTQKVETSMLLRALYNQSNNLIPTILHRCEKLEDPSEIDHRNLIHRLIIHTGRKLGDDTFEISAPSPNLARSTGTPKPSYQDVLSDGTEHSLALLIQNLSPEQRKVISAPDQNRRTPLHYAARYGLSDIASLLIRYYVDWGFIDSSSGVLSAEWRDVEGQTPLDFGVEYNHPITTRIILEHAIPKNSATQSQLNPELIKAARLDSPDLLDALLDFGCNIDYQDARTGETAIYVASKHNFIDSSKFLIARGADIELQESTFGWNPLIVASVDGSLELFKLLIGSGAKTDSVDFSGWTAKEHATLRGHREIFFLFLKHQSKDELSPQTKVNDASVIQRRVNHRTSHVDSEPEDAAKTFGHGYLADPDQKLILVTLGAKDLRHHGAAVELDSIPITQAGATELDTALSLKVSATNCQGTPAVIDLPAPEFGLSTEPISFYSNDPASVQLHFDLISTYSTGKEVLGRGVALLSNIVKRVGQYHTNLDETLTVPLIEAATLRVLGTVTFGFMVVTPFTHPNMGVAKSSTYWKSLISTRVIGHRGLGKNTVTSDSLQLGENTIESFIQAANLGASYVEFDVQLTKDLVPVIYHDFSVSDSGFDIPMHNLTLEQFMHLQAPQRGRKSTQTDQSSHASAGPKRSSSHHGREKEHFSSNEQDRMHLTDDWRKRGVKGNTRGHSIQSKFATLEDLFKTLPKNVGFNIECKYPMMDENEDEGMELTVIEINKWVDTVLKCVYDFRDGRDIIFSSFHPDVCALLSLKQPSIPILFLTEGGSSPMMDVRASSLQEAIRFAKCWNLLGIVSECTPLIECPRLVGVVKNSGLVCVTYGSRNNDPENARLQLKAGVDAVIVDSVLKVRSGLTEFGTHETEASEQ